jgi:hypothetical protein
MLQPFIALIKLSLILVFAGLVIAFGTKLDLRYDAPVSIVFVIFISFLLIQGRKINLTAYSRMLATNQAEALDKIQGRVRINAAIIISAAISLFLELIIIRWHGSLLPFLAFYKNFSLLACFIGLGIGYALADDDEIPLFLTPMLMVIQALFLVLIHYSDISGHLFVNIISEQSSVNDSHIISAAGILPQIRMYVPLYILLATIFLTTALIFVPVGQLCGRLMNLKPGLHAYSCNLAGSIAGTALLFGLSMFWTPPVIWFALATCGLLVFQQYQPAARMAGIATACLIVCIIAWPSASYRQQIYSPYQLIERTGSDYGYMQILAAGTYYQKVYDFSEANTRRKTDARLASVANYYEFPFNFIKKAQNVAVVGAGSGNDVAAALRKGAEHVAAVEIDPAIIYLGRHYHPEHPYDDKRVEVVNTDARRFFRQTKDSFDLIIYGVLDSHILLSHASSVRIDSYVYTQEGLREAYERLKNNGLMAVSFALPKIEMGQKIFRMMQNLDKISQPVAVQTGYDSAMTTTFLIKKGGTITIPTAIIARSGFKNVTADFAAATNVDVPTDDWPFFYMAHRIYPFSYIFVLTLVMVLTIILVKSLLPGIAVEKRLFPFFFLGAGFMLIETKAITELGLVFGNTWHVVSITIICILVMAWLANLLVAKINVSRTIPVYCALLCLILFSYFVASAGNIKFTGYGAFLFAILITAPVFFSGIIFSGLLKKNEGSISRIMAYNLMGAMVGGVLEYNAMYFGYAFLYLLAFIIYALALATGLNAKRA